MAEASGRPHNDADDEDESPVSQPDAVIEAPLASNSSLYGTFAWSVALPENPCPQDSLADISKIRQFRWVLDPPRRFLESDMCTRNGPARRYSEGATPRR